jgi:hypothetical protein
LRVNPAAEATIGAGDDVLFAALRLLPAADKQLEFLVTTDERRCPRAQGLEAAQHPALANNPPCRLAQAIARATEAGADPASDSSPIRSPTTAIPVAMPPHAQMFSRRQSADRLDHRQPGAHRPLGEVRT